jgi:transglutaminase-like putative cysteine protease
MSSTTEVSSEIEREAKSQCGPDHPLIVTMKLSSRKWIRRLPARAALLAVLPTMLLLAQPVRSLTNSFSVKPAPSWVQPVPVSYTENEFSRNSGSGAVCLLTDQQTRVSAAGVERYWRTVTKVMNATGLDDASQLEIEFEPTYQKLTIHYIQIRRGDKTINALLPSEIKLIQKEEELDQRLYNGTLSAVAFLHGVRAGDVVDCAYTITGDNPVLGGKFADHVLMASDLPAQMLRCRLLWPSSRTLSYRLSRLNGTAVTQIGSETEYLWERTDVPRHEFEYDSDWSDPFPTIEFSEFNDWSDVVRWAKPLYEVKRPLSKGLISQIERWRAESQTAGERLIVALRFVQDEVRYLGIELGTYSHTPTQPSAVCERRFGDCKDKSLLLVTALRQLGIEADPALVSTDDGDVLADEQPSPYAFNHVIVRATLDGSVYWFDPTISLQRGGLDQHYNPGYGRALVVRDGVGSLEEIPNPESPHPTTELKEIYSAGSNQGPASLEVITTYRRADADAVRYSLSKQSLSEFIKTYVGGYYQQLDPAMEREGQPQLQDDSDSNTLVITERYKLSSFWQDQRRLFYAGRISSELGNAIPPTRKTPLPLDYPSFISETIEARLPSRFSIAADSGAVSTDQLDFRYSFNSNANVVTLNYQLRVLKDHVPPDQLGRHSEAVEKIQRLLAYEISRSGQSRGGSSRLGLSTYLPLVLVFGPFVVFGALKFIVSRRQRVRRGDFRERLKMAPGSTAEAAIAVASPTEFDSHLSSARCVCGGGLRVPGEGIEAETIILAGKRVSVVSLKCERCPRATDLYFAIRE